MTVIEATGLTRRYGDRDVVAGASLVIEAKDSVALLGPSGCGKTTLLQMIGVLDRPSAGSLLVAGSDAWAMGEAARARLRLDYFGFVFQQNNLLSRLSVIDNVALPAWRLGGSRRQALSLAARWLERFGLAERAQAPPAQLSAGEAQRAAIARALVNGPKLVLADEPTGSLDSQSSALVLDALDQVRDAGAALLIVTHEPTVAERAGRRIAMRDGRLV